MEFTFAQYRDNKSKDEKESPNNRLANDTPIPVKPLQSEDLRNRINQNQPAKTLQSDDLRNRINQKREQQSTDVIDLTVDDSDASKASRYEGRQTNVQSDKKLPPVTSRNDSLPSNQHETHQAPTKPSDGHPPLAKNNPFYFDVSKPPPSNIQFNRMQDRLKIAPKMADASSEPIQNVTTNVERKSVNDRLRLARQVPPVPNVSVFWFKIFNSKLLIERRR